MRKTFFENLYKIMKQNPNVWALTGDLGWGGFDAIQKDYPNRFINCGAAEQSMMGIAVGLAQEGKIPFVYSITPFLVYRPFETIKIYLSGERAKVLLVGSGRDKDYAHDGPSHDATGVEKYLELLGIAAHFPNSESEIEGILKEMIREDGPSFLSLRR